MEPQWTFGIQVGDRGIRQATFTVDMFEPVADAEEAMRHLTTVALWWLDTRQFESLSLNQESDPLDTGVDG